MTASTPFHPQHEKLAEDASRYVDVASIPWKPTLTPGIDMKVLMQDEASGLLTALFRWAPGTQLPLHEHVEIEQTYVLKAASSTTRAKCARAASSGVPRATATSRVRQRGRSCCPSS